jgi:WD40 repeat protein
MKSHFFLLVFALHITTALSGLTQTTVFRHEGLLRCVGFSPDGNQIVTVGGSQILGNVMVWDRNTQELLQFFTGHSLPITCFDISADGKTLVTGGGDGLAILWDLETGLPIQYYSGHLLEIRDIEFTSDESRIITCSVDTTIRVWDVESGNTVRIISGLGNEFTSISVESENPWVLSAEKELPLNVGVRKGRGRLWNYLNGQQLSNYPDPTTSYIGMNLGIVELTHDNRSFAAGFIGPNDSYLLTIWDVTSGELLQEFEGHSGEINSIAFSLDDSYVLTGSDDETVTLWNAFTGEIEELHDTYNSPITSVAVSPIDGFFLTGTINGSAYLQFSELLEPSSVLSWMIY